MRILIGRDYIGRATRLKMHNDVVEILLMDGKVVSALQYASINPSVTVPTQVR